MTKMYSQEYITKKGIAFDLEVRVIDEGTKKPIKNASVSINGKMFRYNFINDYYLVKAMAGQQLVVVHPGFVRGACWEIERCVEELGLKVLCLPTHFMDSIGQWRCVFDKENDPIFELANKYKLAIEIHPYDGDKMIKLENTNWRFHLIWMLAQCGDAYHFYTLNGMQERFPNIRTCFAHGGQLAQMNLGRRIQGFDGRPDLFEGKTHPRKAVGHPNIYFDTLVHDTDSLKLMIDRQGSNQIIMGLDDPYPLGEMESDAQSSYPGKLLDLAIERKLINEQEYHEIWEDNTLRWLFGDDEQAKKDLVNKILS